MGMPTLAIEFVPEEEAPRRRIGQTILCVLSRCDLDCPQCPVYHLADTRWERSPLKMEEPIAAAAGRAINEHVAAVVAAGGENRMDVVLFGGEPCAQGVGPIRTVVEALRANTPDVKDLRFTMTTNGVRLGKDPELRAYLRSIGCTVGISLDGYRELNDAYRQHHDAGGKRAQASLGTFDEIAPAIHTWNRENPDSHAGILVTLHDPRETPYDPIELYDTVMGFQPRAVDFLLNHNRIGKQEPVRDLRDLGEADATYGSILVALYNHHQSIPADRRIPVRVLDEIPAMLEGRSTGSSVFGTIQKGRMLAVSTGGEIELEVAYGAAFNGAARTGIHVRDEGAFDKALRHPLVVRAQLGLAGLSRICQHCQLRRLCGGGPPASRYWHKPSGNKSLSELEQRFDWPSAHCASLATFILHVWDGYTVT